MSLFTKGNDELIKSIQKKFDYYEKRIEHLEEENSKLRDEHYKDSELQRITSELKKMKEDYYRGFPISADESKAIEAWRKDWFDRKRGGNTYMGACGGGFTYKFHPTGIGTSGVVIAPDGEEFEFQELG